MTAIFSSRIPFSLFSKYHHLNESLSTTKVRGNQHQMVITFLPPSKERSPIFSVHSKQAHGQALNCTLSYNLTKSVFNSQKKAFNYKKFSISFLIQCTILRKKYFFVVFFYRCRPLCGTTGSGMWRIFVSTVLRNQTCLEGQCVLLTVFLET